MAQYIWRRRQDTGSNLTFERFFHSLRMRLIKTCLPGSTGVETKRVDPRTPVYSVVPLHPKDPAVQMGEVIRLTTLGWVIDRYLLRILLIIMAQQITPSQQE